MSSCRILLPGPAALIAGFAGLLLAAACQPEQEDPPVLELRIPAGEEASIGSYAVVLRWPDRPVERIAGERDGSVEKLWFHDLDGDGRGEVLVVTRSAGSGGYGALQVWSRDAESAWQPLEVPDLHPHQAGGYMGHDAFTLVDGELWREYPIYREEDPNARPTGGQARLRFASLETGWVRQD